MKFNVIINVVINNMTSRKKISEETRKRLKEYGYFNNNEKQIKSFLDKRGDNYDRPEAA